MTRSRTAWLCVLIAAVALTLVRTASAMAALSKGDVVVVLDESGSLAEEIADVRANITLIAAQAAGRIDAQFALVGFGGASPGVPVNEPFTRTDFTTATGLNAAAKRSGAFPGNGGGVEMGLDATTYAMTRVAGFRDDAAACVILVSDESPSFRTDEASDLGRAIAALEDRGASWFGVVQTADATVRRTYGPDPGSLAAVSGGGTFAIGAFRRDPSSVLAAVVSKCARTVQVVNARCTIRGTKGRDVLRGTRERDVICGLGGNDVIRGAGGGDVLRGGAGDDVVRGDKGADHLIGGRGDDRLAGGDGKDVVRGGRGRDRLSGGFGRDRLSGGFGRDRLWAADSWRDRLDGGAGSDIGVIDRRLDRLRAIERTMIKPRHS